MNRNILLWPNEAHYTAESPDQAPHSIKEFKADGSRGAVVVCPGGGYVMKAEHEGDPVAKIIQSAGISAYTLDYRVSPCHYLAPLTDALRAIRVLRSMGYEKVGILGFSAGGHLTCTAATMYTEGDPASGDPIERYSSRPDAFIPCYAVTSVTAYAHVGSRVGLLGAHADDPALLHKFSASENVTKETTPALICHSSDDEEVQVQNSLMLAEALAKNSVPFELHIFPHGHHGLGLAEDYPDISQWAKLCQDWLLRQGFAS